MVIFSPNLFKNKLALEIIALTAILQVVMTQFVGGFFNATQLSLEMWIKIIFCGSWVVIANEIIKQMLRGAKHSAKYAYHQVRRVNVGRNKAS